MTIALFVATALAVWQAVEVVHHSDAPFFATLRARAEASDSVTLSVFLCPWCLSVWIGLIFAFATVYVAKFPTTILGGLLSVGLVGLGASRLANVLNDVTHHWCRTPREDLAPNGADPSLRKLPDGADGTDGAKSSDSTGITYDG